MKRTILTILLALTTLGCGVGWLATTNSLDTSLQETNYLESQIGSLNSQIQSQKAQIDLLEGYLESHHRELESTRSELEQLEEKLDLYKETFGEISLKKIPYATPQGLQAKILNNEASRNPTYAELLTFLKEDRTDANLYIPETYVCINFAVELHNNAEKQKIRAAIVVVDFKDPPLLHALNAFETSDKGLIYIDVTGVRPSQPGPTHRDREISLVTNWPYSGNFLFASKWKVAPLGIVKWFEIIW